METIYLDYAATSPVRPEVLETMMPYFTHNFGNPSSIYQAGQAAKTAIEDAREEVAKHIGATPREVYFTGSGTEANNWAIKMAAFTNKKRGNHIITTDIEHHAVLCAFQYLADRGFQVTYLPVDEYGLIAPSDFEKAITPETTFASIMLANNEIGTIEPIRELADIANKHNVIFHTDAVQAVGHIPVSIEDLGVDMLSLAAHKFGGPKGVGALYVKKDIDLSSFIHGGMQEHGKRAGTENVASIVGMASALDLAEKERDAESVRLIQLRDYLIKEIMDKISHTKLNGHPTSRLPNNVNFSFNYIEGESMLLMLDSKGICASSGSACTSGSLDPSHVLLGIGLEHGIAHGSLRITMGPDTTKEKIDCFINEITGIVAKLRAMSPLYEGE